MSIGSWLALADYSTKYKVSVSTLRRRIKAEDINFRLADGKYFIIDEPMSTHQNHRPSLTSDTMVGTHSPNLKNSIEDILASYAQPQPQTQPKETSAKPDHVRKNEEQILSTAHKLLTELKRAYTQILQEKEEQILQLKEEISDLKTLVKALESENQKSKKRQNNC